MWGIAQTIGKIIAKLPRYAVPLGVFHALGNAQCLRGRCFSLEEHPHRILRHIFIFAQKLLVKTERGLRSIKGLFGVIIPLELGIGRFHILDFSRRQKLHFGAQTASDNRVVHVKPKPHSLADVHFFFDIIADQAVELLRVRRALPRLFPLGCKPRDFLFIDRNASVQTVGGTELAHQQE